MAFDIVKHTSSALYSLRADVDWLGILDDESMFAMAGLKWRTFIVEFNPKQESVILPSLLIDTIGSELGRFVVLNDPAYNEIEVLVERKDEVVCFSHGWNELNVLYGLKNGGAVTLVNVQPSRFVIQVRDRYGEEINYPRHVPPMSFKLNHEKFPVGVPALFTAKRIIPYRHHPDNFNFSFSKWLSVDEAAKGYLTLSYDPVLESVMPINTKDFYLTGDTGHVWRCTHAFVRSKEPHYKIEGEWKQFCLSRNVIAGSFIRIGAPSVGANISFYVTLQF